MAALPAPDPDTVSRWASRLATGDTLEEFEQNATDAEIAMMSETRTARAFMLLGRVTGTFD